jgi:predicted Fe-Mo cluster-binding NifX family protein
MKVAITYENGKVFEHFGQTENFIFYEVKDNKVVSEEIKNTNGLSHAELIGFLKDNKTDVLICGNLGGHAINLLKDNNIDIYAGNSGDTKDLINLFVKKELKKINLDEVEHNCECHCH